MKYIRIVVAVEDEDEQQFREALDTFIESDEYFADNQGAPVEYNHIQGAYVSIGYPTREAAIGENWINDVDEED